MRPLSISDMFPGMQSTRRHIADDGFTLAELLVVISIIGIMFLVALPSLTSLAGQSKLDGAANAVHSAAKMARQFALANNQPTYLVFHDAQSTTNHNLAYRSYAVFTINIHTNPVTQAAGYFLTDWEMLPTGVVFDDLAGSDTNVFQISEGDEWDGAFSKNNLLHIRNDDYIAFGFKPSGKAASATHHIHLAEGSIANGQPFTTSKQGKQIQFATIGASKIMDYIYGENGNIRILGEE